MGKAPLFIWLVLGDMETQTLEKKSNTAGVGMGMDAVLSFCFSNQKEHQKRNFHIRWSLVPTEGYYLVVLGAVTCEIGKAVKPGKGLPWSHGWVFSIS